MKNNLVLKIIIGVLIVLVVGLTIKFVASNPKEKTNTTETTTTVTISPTTVTLAPVTTSTTKLSSTVPSNWSVYKNTENGFGFSYPKDTFYRDPDVKITDCTSYPDLLSTCNPKTTFKITSNAGILNGFANKDPSVTKTVINNIPFCVYKWSEGAAGSIYNENVYLTMKNQKCFIIDLLVRTNDMCDSTGNPPNPTACEENNQNLLKIPDQVISTFHF